MTDDITWFPDAVVVGSGFAGAVTARQLAEAGRRVDLLEKRPQTAGNMYDAHDDKGVLVHWFGPHIFHTGKKHVYEYLSRFTEWNRYEHRVLGYIENTLVPIPFNYTSMERLLPAEKAERLQQKLPALFPGKKRVSVLDLSHCPDKEAAELGKYVYDHVFAGYTAKQWGIPIEKVDASVINRVPVVLGYDDHYFEDEYQAMPAKGYTKLFQNLLNHPNIHCRVNTPANASIRLSDDGTIYYKGTPFAGPVVYTGAPDALLEYKFGALPYRSLDLHFSSYDQEEYQPAAVVNYPETEGFTRITEFKKLTGQKLPNATTILAEYPMDYDKDDTSHEPYYPIENAQNRALYEKHLNELAKWPSLFLCGRLAEYKYYNMDAVVDQALTLALEIVEGDILE